MALGFYDGFEFYQKNAGSSFAAFQGGAFGSDRAEYVKSVEDEIAALNENMNAFRGDNTPVKQLKGKTTEVLLSGTFNVNAAKNRSSNRTVVESSNEFGSVDISSNFGEDFGLKYYATGEESAKQQAKSVLQRFMEYKSRGGKDSQEKYLADRLYTNEDALNDPMYLGQVRVIPMDQLKDAKTYLKNQIHTAKAIHPEKVKRLQETLSMLQDRIKDNEGNESITISLKESEKLAALAKEGHFNAEALGITAPELLNLEMVVKKSLKAGLSAAVISLVLKVGPEIFSAIDYLVKNGEIDKEQFQKIGFAAITGASEGFINGSVAAAIMACCESGVLGEALEEVSPGIVGAIVAVTVNTMKNAYQVAVGKKSRKELSNELIRDLFVSSSAHLMGIAGQAVLKELPVVGYLVGSFVGSVVGSFVYNTGYKVTISFCTETGVTMFGLVDQDYTLPEDIIKEMDLETFDFDTFSADTFEADAFKFETFDPESIRPDTLGIKMLRRGVIGITRVGYVE